jgi:hypothetical protein
MIFNCAAENAKRRKIQLCPARAFAFSARDGTVFVRQADFICRSSRGSDCRFVTSSQLLKANERKTDALLRGGTRARANRSKEIATAEFTAGREGMRSLR